MSTRYLFGFALLLLAGCGSQRQAVSSNDATALNLLRHIGYLAADSLQGRRTGTEGERKAAAYIANEFRIIGLQPKGTEGFYQPFPVAEGREMTAANELSINGQPLKPGTDFFPLPYSANADLNALASPALMEKGEPWFFDLEETMAANARSPHFDANDAVIAKAKQAAAKGAAALFVYNRSAVDDGLAFDGRSKAEVLSIPVVYIGKEAAKKKLADPSALFRLKARTEVKEKRRSGENVVGYLDNGAARTVVVGAHFDHLGYGEDRNSLFAGSGEVHNGADDNASGTAALIELARLLKASPLTNNNVLFIAFSGEELGLFGSKYFVEHPTVDLGAVNFMLNMDMIGRLNDSTKTLTVGGYGTSPAWAELYSRQGKEALANRAYALSISYRFDSSGTGPSDHTSFYNKGIPVLFYFTGLHTDYHKPSDDADKISYQGERAIVAHIYSLLQAADRKEEKLAFTKTREAQTATSARWSVSLGIMPDYTFSGAGVRADGVTDGRPAQKAGLRAGDVITALGEHKITSMEGYMQALGKFKKGDRTTVSYTRNGQALSAAVEF